MVKHELCEPGELIGAEIDGFKSIEKFVRHAHAHRSALDQDYAFCVDG